MRVVRWHDFGPVQGLELGYSLVGQPFMTVHCWFVDSLLVDTGLGHGRAAMMAAAKRMRPRAVLLTHSHEDHSANAGTLHRRLGLPIYAHAVAVERLRHRLHMLPYRHLVWGQIEPVEAEPAPERIEGDQVVLETIPTPGHTSDHLAFWAPSLGALFTGDLYLGDRIKYFRRNENYAELMTSLRRVVGLDVELLLCAHRPHRRDGRKRLALKLQFMEDLLGEVGRYHQQGLSAEQIVSRQAWSGVRMVKWFTFGDASAENMIRAAIRALPGSNGDAALR